MSPTSFQTAPPRVKMGESGFEPLKALPADLQSVPFGHSGTLPLIEFALIKGQKPMIGLEPITC